MRMDAPIYKIQLGRMRECNDRVWCLIRRKKHKIPLCGRFTPRISIHPTILCKRLIKKHPIILMRGIYLITKKNEFRFFP